ncbi:hypothetical protein F511_27990 [Dorcoceras hygrometricum]|uniref:Reverse transcriptase domain-containing protein n=1 Tax=Dorcoceras hygrometricum TaxID=472368 RepID=A0A2Z7B7J4_9LAMI|nr:hypothetical protein F511_27990 [Dorcoceras hygrometricum]
MNVVVVDALLKIVPGDILDREIEFAIELIPGATIVSKPPFRLTPTEMREL